MKRKRVFIIVIAISIVAFVCNFIENNKELLSVYNNWMNGKQEVSIYSGTARELYPITSSKDDIEFLLEKINAQRTKSFEDNGEYKYYNTYRILLQDTNNHNDYLLFTFFNDFNYLSVQQVENDNTNTYLYIIKENVNIIGFFEKNDVLLDENTVIYLEGSINNILQNQKFRELINLYGTQECLELVKDINSEYCTLTDVSVFKSVNGKVTDKTFMLSGKLSCDERLICYIVLESIDNTIEITTIDIIAN